MQFRLVILDNMKDQLDNPSAQHIFSDMIFAKQKNFLRTDPNFVVMDKHDMIGTHYLIYDVQNFLQPRLIFAIRTTFLQRAQNHKIETPLMSLLPAMAEESRAAFTQFLGRHPRLVDCNAWFVDPEYSRKNSGMNLSDLGYFMVVMHLVRMGYDNFVGCANETYNASRWLKGMGFTPDGFYFEHPVVKSQHKLVLMEDFNLSHFEVIFKQYESLIQELVEVFPQEVGELPSLANYARQVLPASSSGPVATSGVA